MSKLIKLIGLTLTFSFSLSIFSADEDEKERRQVIIDKETSLKRSEIAED